MCNGFCYTGYRITINVKRNLREREREIESERERKKYSGRKDRQKNRLSERFTEIKRERERMIIKTYDSI